MTAGLQGAGSGHTALADARSLLFVPGNRPERFDKAARSGAHAVVLDLEDSVPPRDKAAARRAIAEHWAGLEPGRRDVDWVIRINAPSGTGDCDDDLALLARLAETPRGRPAAVMAPKAESVQGLAHLREALPGWPVLPLIETAAGWRDVDAVAQAPGVLRLCVGHIDFMADTGIDCGPEEAELAPLRFAVAMATRLAGLAPAIDGVTAQVDDLDRLAADARRARRFGFGGKLCVHPGQVATVHRAFSPTERELDWARRVIEADAAAGGAAVQLDGRMVDLPVVRAARRLLRQAGAA